MTFFVFVDDIQTADCCDLFPSGLSQTQGFHYRKVVLSNIKLCYNAVLGCCHGNMDCLSVLQTSSTSVFCSRRGREMVLICTANGFSFHYCSSSDCTEIKLHVLKDEDIRCGSDSYSFYK